MSMRDQIKEGVMRELKKLEANGTSTTQVAAMMKVHWSTVNNWINGYKVPRFPTVSCFEQLFRVKVIK